MSGFNFNGLKKMRDKIGNALSDAEINNCLVSTTKELGDRVKRNAKNRTPTGVYKGKKTGGTLKRGWKTTEVERIGKSFSITVYNDVKYAIYVEKGHRTRKRKDGSRGWVEGKFMLEKAQTDVKKVMDRVIKDKVDKLLKGGFK